MTAPHTKFCAPRSSRSRGPARRDALTVSDSGPNNDDSDDDDDDNDVDDADERPAQGPGTDGGEERKG